MFALITAFLFIERPSASVWAVIGLFAALVAAGFIVFGLGRIGGNRRRNEPLPLDLSGADASIRPERHVTPMRPPKVPEKWRALVASRPPRDVYLPSKVWKAFAVEGVTLLFTIYAYVSKANKHHTTLIGFLSAFVDPANLGLLLVYAATWVIRLKKILTTREILRDGEVAMAYTIDRSWSHATYQFWSQTGQIFEHRTTVVKRAEFLAEFSVVPVFYIPADPRKSVALYGTEFMIRLPENAVPQPLTKAPASA